MKDKRNYWAIIISFVLIFIYIFYECYSVTHVTMKTTEATVSTIYDTVDASALIIRDEETVSADDNKIVVPTVSDGEKIKVNGKIANEFSAKEDAEKFSKIQKLQNQLKYYRELESQSSGQIADIESIDNEIVSGVNDYVTNCNSTNYTNVKTSSDNLNDLFTRRQLLIGEKIDFTSIITDLNSQINKLKSKSYLPSSSISSEKSGYFSSYTDGLERLVDYDDAKNLTIKQIKNYTKQAEKTKSTGAIGKMIYSFNWYMAMVVDCNKITSLENGDTIEVCLKDDSDKIINAKIISGADTSLGQKQAPLILECKDLTSDLTSIRTEDIEIRLTTYEGIKLPATALHVEKGKQGVYALVSNQVKFRQVEVAYTDNNYVVAKYSDEDTNGIKLHDKIITEGKDLYDGKVCS